MNKTTLTHAFAKVLPLFIMAALLVLANHFAAIPAAFVTILNHALNPWSVGGAAVGDDSARGCLLQ